MRLSSAFRVLTASVGLCLQFAPTLSHAAAMDPPYFSIEPALQATTTKKIEVVEVFSYACSHCAQFQSKVDEWRKTLNTKKVEFAYVPAPYSATDKLLARGFIAAQRLGVAERTHSEIFAAIHTRGFRVGSFDQLAILYGDLGVAPDKFTSAVKDPTVDTELSRIINLMLSYKVDSTPTLIVAGKYRITVDTAGSQDAMLIVADSLIAQEIAASSATSRQAPKSGK